MIRSIGEESFPGFRVSEKKENSAKSPGLAQVRVRRHADDMIQNTSIGEVRENSARSKVSNNSGKQLGPCDYTLSYHATIIIENPWGYSFCSGGIIGSKWVVTAADCLRRPKYNNSVIKDGLNGTKLRRFFYPSDKFKVVVGVSSIQEALEKAKNSSKQHYFEVETAFINENFFSNRNSGESIFDERKSIVIIKVCRRMYRREKTSKILSGKIQSLYIPAFNVTARGKWRSRVIASGFSGMEASMPNSGKIMCAPTEVLNDDVCDKHFAHHKRSRVICTSGRSKKICPGDRGSPLVVCDPVKGCFLIGIHVIGLPCGSRDPPYYYPYSEFGGFVKSVIRNYNDKKKLSKSINKVCSGIPLNLTHSITNQEIHTKEILGSSDGKKSAQTLQVPPTSPVPSDFEFTFDLAGVFIDSRQARLKGNKM